MTKKKDFSAAKIKFLLEEKGMSLLDVDRLHGLPLKVCQNTLNTANIKGEKAISSVLNIHAKDIWPSRYDTKGKRLKPQPLENYTCKPRFRQGLKAA